MNNHLVRCLLFLFFCSGVFPGGAWGGHPGIDWNNPVFTEEYVPGELLIGFKDEISAANVFDVHQQFGVQILQQFSIVPVSHVRLPHHVSMTAAALQYAAHPAVEYVEPNYIVRPFPTYPNDPEYQDGTLWGMDRINAPKAWTITTGNEEIVVGVIDTGVFEGHEDLALNIAPGGYDFANDTANQQDTHGHGTHVAGTIGAVGDNNIGVVGVNWRVKMIGIKFLDPSGTTANAIRSVEYAATNTALNIKLTNNSWGGGGYSQGLFEAIKAAGEVYGQLFIAAAGNAANDNDANPVYPANYDLPNVITVAALAESGDLADFSNFGAQTVHFAAPGVGILSTIPGGLTGEYASFSGTSMAAPHVAGAIALLWGMVPDAPYTIIRDALLDSVALNENLEGMVITGGELDMYAAVRSVKPQVLLDRLTYRSDATVGVTVLDPTLEPPIPASVEALVEVRDPDEILRWGDLLALPQVAGIRFSDSFVLATGVTAVEFDTLTVTYTNEAGEIATASAPIDDTSPTISNVVVWSVTDDSATVQWFTDEPADTRYIITTDIPGGGLAVLPEEGGGVFVDTPTLINETPQYVHTVVIPLPEGATVYYLAVLSEDYAGNQASFPADLTSRDPSEYTRIIALHRRDAYVNDMEFGEAGWTVTNLGGASVWEYGSPLFGPPGAFKGERVWGTILDGNYPPLAKAALVSTPVEVKLFPRLSFWHWHDIRRATTIAQVGDFGMVEVNAGSGWHNVTARAVAYDQKIDGRSEGWRRVVIDLPEFEHESIRVRFQFESDEQLTAAGWYIDDVLITHVQPPGLNIIGYTINDTAGGDGDGFPEPGESFYLNLEVFNSTQNLTLTVTNASVTIPTPQVHLTPPTSFVNYGVLEPGARATSGMQLAVSIDNDPELLGTTFTAFHSSPDADGQGVFIDTLTIEIVERESVTGWVTNFFTGLPIEDALVRGVASGYPDVEALTLADGSYALHGLAPGVTYDVRALKPGEYSPSESVSVQGPAASINFGLGRAYADPDPLSFFVDVPQEHALILTNLLLDNALGNIPLVYEIQVDYYPNAAMFDVPKWLAVDPDMGSVPAGADVLLNVEINPGDLAPSFDPYRADIRLISNDIGGEDLLIPVTLFVNPSPILYVHRVYVLGGDGDGFPEPGEMLDLEIVLGNRGDEFAIFIDGVLSYEGGSATTVVDSFGDWLYVPPGGLSGYFLFRPQIEIDGTLNDGDVLPFSLSVIDLFDYEAVLTFDLTVTVRRAISGNVYDLITSDPVPGAVVKAEGPGFAGQAVTDAAGDYQIFGLTNGTYEVYVIPPVPYGAPPSVNVGVANADAVGVDFAVASWGISANPTSIVVHLPEGVETNLTLTLQNDGPYDGFVELGIELVSGVPHDLIGEFELPAIDWAALPPEAYAHQELLVRFEDDSSIQAQEDALTAVGASVLRRLHAVPAAHIRVPGNLSLEWTAQHLTGAAAIRYVEPNYLQEPYGEPDDPFFSIMYALHNTRQTGGTLGADIRALEAWETTVGREEVVIAVVDTGIKLDHVDLEANLVLGYDFGNDDADPSPDYPAIGAEHGTHVAGTVGAVGHNATGVVGVNWNSKIMPLKASTNFPGILGFPIALLPHSATLAALEYAITNEVKISNHSYGGIYFSGLMYEMIATALSNDHLFVVAAGNSRINNDVFPHYPASYNLDNVLAVAATDHHGLLASFSNFGEQTVDIAAPGVDIYSTYMLGATLDSYEALSGTSMAAPHVAGVAGLLKSIAPWATYSMLKDAILLGSRHDPALEGIVASASHLDAAGAVERIKAFWLQIDPMKGQINSSDTLPVDVTINFGGRLPTGTYEAHILVKGGQNQLAIPVEVHILPAPYPVITEVRVDDSQLGDSDGHAEPGETVDLFVTLYNDGSAVYMSPTGTLSSSTPGVTITENTAAWPGIPNGDQQVNTTGFRVTMPGIAGDVDFELTMTHATQGPWILSFTVPVETRHSITGFVRDNQTLTGLADVPVEFWGASGGRVTTAGDGSYRIDGLENGAYRVRAVGAAHEKSALEQVVVLNADQMRHFNLRQPDIAMGATQMVFAVQVGQDDEQELDIINTHVDAFDFDVVVSKPRRVGLISDENGLVQLKPVLQETGWTVQSWSNNLVVVNGVPGGRYTTDDEVVLTKDLLVLDLNGRNGTGRLLSLAEETLLRQYVKQGGRIIVTGGNVLSRPDDRRLRDLVGSSSLDRSETVGSQAELVAAVPVDPFWAEIMVGDRLAVATRAYDDATPSAEPGVSAHIQVDGATKLLRRETAEGGVVYLWNGNPAVVEWRERGVWRDVLLGLLESELATAVPWLSVTPPGASVSDDTLPLTVRADSTGLDFGTHRAVIMVRGNYAGADVQAIPVVFELVQPTLRAQSTTGVKNWMDEFIQGKGGGNASLFQLIDAGPDGEINPPMADGNVMGDDVVLLTFPFSRNHGRFGVGYEWLPDLGLFNEIFGHDIQLSALPRTVYVRAWDAATFEDSVAYGDSSLYELALTAYEQHDFGTWIVNQVIGYPGPLASLRDSNGDSIPDGWYIMNGLDPRRPIAPLAASWSLERKAGAFGTGPAQFRFPTQLFLTESFVFVLDRQNTRVSVWNRDDLTHVHNFGGSGTGSGQFNNPYGMGLALNANRFAIADTANHRIQVFTFDPDTGAIAFERQFGSFGSGAGQFNQPRDVAIGPLDRFYVADMNNHRIQVFDPNGTHLFSFGAFGTGNGLFKSPQGITVDENGIIYVADTENNRIQGFTGGGGYLWKTGTAGSGPGQFNKPIGMQLGLGGRIYIADTSNHRIQVLDAARNHVGSLGQQGGGDTDVNFPHDVAPSFTSAAVYVADTWNHRLLKLDTILDGDGNGMDDTWELLNFGMVGVDPHADPDNDGLSNIGEFRLRTDPNNPDTDGDGWTDGQEVAAGSDPLDPNDTPPYTLYIETAGGAPLIWITWMAIEGEVYDVQSTTNLWTGPWITLPGSVFTSDMTSVVGYTNTLQGGEMKLFMRPRQLE